MSTLSLIYGHPKRAISHDKTRTFGGLILRCETTPTTRLPETWRYEGPPEYQ